MATMQDVRRWVMLSGIAHIVACEKHGWAYTLCETLTTGEATCKPPIKRRVCRKCRTKLAAATVASGGGP